MPRKAGQTNQPKRALLSLIQEKWPNYHPVLEMADLANDPEADISLRFNANKEVAQYVAAKRKAIELTGKEGGPLQVVASLLDESI